MLAVLLAATMSRAPTTPSDPAQWSRASCLPDHSGLDTLDDILHQTAIDELRAAMNGETPQKKVVRVVVRVAHVGIEKAAEAGLLPGGNSAVFNEAQARLLAEIIDAPNAKLHAQCVDIVFGHGIMLGMSMTKLADLHGQTKSNVSKICVSIRERYNVPPSRAMKSLDACDSYRKRQQGRRAKPARENWKLSEYLKHAFHAGIPAAA